MGTLYLILSGAVNLTLLYIKDGLPTGTYCVGGDSAQYSVII